MQENRLTSLDQLRSAITAARDLSSEVAATAAGAIREAAEAKQDKFTTDGTMTLQGGTLGVKTPVRGVTQAEYDALPEAEKQNTLFIITDAEGGGAAASKEYVDALAAGKQDKLTGSAGQVAGFGADGNLTAMDAPSGGVSKAYVDGLIGDIGAVLDAINGEAV